MMGMWGIWGLWGTEYIIDDGCIRTHFVFKHHFFRMMEVPKEVKEVTTEDTKMDTLADRRIMYNAYWYSSVIQDVTRGLDARSVGFKAILNDMLPRGVIDLSALSPTQQQEYENDETSESRMQDGAPGRVSPGQVLPSNKLLLLDEAEAYCGRCGRLHVVKQDGTWTCATCK